MGYFWASLICSVLHRNDAAILVHCTSIGPNRGSISLINGSTEADNAGRWMVNKTSAANCRYESCVPLFMSDRRLGNSARQITGASFCKDAEFMSVSANKREATSMLVATTFNVAASCCRDCAIQYTEGAGALILVVHLWRRGHEELCAGWIWRYWPASLALQTQGGCSC